MDLREMGDWPREAEKKYERMEVLGRGSFGMVWMSRRTTSHADDEFDDEYVAIKNINIKDEKGKVYAEREICILQELRHPNVIRLIRSYNVHCGDSRLVVMQLARGPNLHQLVVKRGALGIPLGRLVSRQLIAAVSYLHGRAVIHRDIKPSNCILACTSIPLTHEYDWYIDHDIWNNSVSAQKAVASGKWKLMLVDFGFARALEREEIMTQARPMRNSIVFESSAAAAAVTGVPSSKAAATTAAATASTILEESESQEIDLDDDMKKETKKEEEAKVEESSDKKNEEVKGNATIEKEGASTSDAAVTAAATTAATAAATGTRGGGSGDTAVAAFTHLNDKKDNKNNNGDDDDTDDDEILGKLAEQAASRMKIAFEPTSELENEIMGTGARKRISGVSMPIDSGAETNNFGTTGTNNNTSTGGGSKMGRRISTARLKVRSMSALGTKAYAAPEIRKKLRHKTDADFSKANAAMTECVADYGMIVDSYSVGWTLRVALTGVPPNFTISEYMMERERDMIYMAGDDDKSVELMIADTGCCCIKGAVQPGIRIRDPSMLPYDATLLIAHMTEKNPEDRITVREAQNHPWITGPPGETPPYVLPQGDVPAKHGDPVVPLNCAPALSKLTVQYHMQ